MCTEECLCICGVDGSSCRARMHKMLHTPAWEYYRTAASCTIVMIGMGSGGSTCMTSSDIWSFCRKTCPRYVRSGCLDPGVSFFAGYCMPWHAESHPSSVEPEPVQWNLCCERGALMPNYSLVQRKVVVPVVEVVCNVSDLRRPPVAHC